ncbi:MAG TPA: hypothetical protein VHM70_11845 [Polyangiaceae bacterium]|nr:hypothetical protein [Polyangiaceae bacterium]
MNSFHAAGHLLVTLHLMSQNNETIELIGLCERADVNLYKGLKALHLLGQLELVNPRRLRLTLNGLVVAKNLLNLKHAGSPTWIEPLFQLAA